MTRLAPLLGLALLAAGSPAAAADGGCVLRPGDRVVLYGDSITEQRLYSGCVAQYVACRYPDLGVRFFNAGWGGDTVPGAKARLERDVLELKPTLVTLFFGMNDGGYRRRDDAVVAAYRANLADLVKTLKGKGVRVVVLGPGCCDGVRNPALGACEYDGMLEALTAAAAEVAKDESCPFGDVFHPMRDALAARRKADPAMALVPDGVHPDAEGHLLIANAMLRALGAEPMPGLGEFDAKSGRGRGLKLAKSSGEDLVLTTTGPAATPFWFDPKHLRTMRESGFLEGLAGTRLTVTGLTQERYFVLVDGEDADASTATFSADELARGVALPGCDSARGRRVRELVAQREANYFRAWREVRLGLAGVAGSDRAYQGLLALDEGFHAKIAEAAAPAPSASIRLTPAPPGENLALHKTYKSTDPNTFNWGIGGLTDGSWESDAAHCFATGNADAFPKTVTIDLGAVASVGGLRLGVPEFGSTRNVALSLSADGRTFADVARVAFAQRKRAARTFVFAPVRARFVRITYADSWPEAVEYPPAFCFTTECEVWGER